MKGWSTMKMILVKATTLGALSQTRVTVTMGTSGLVVIEPWYAVTKKYKGRAVNYVEEVVPHRTFQLFVLYIVDREQRFPKVMLITLASRHLLALV